MKKEKCLNNWVAHNWRETCLADKHFW
jgi:hypothetical protein